MALRMMDDTMFQVNSPRWDHLYYPYFTEAECAEVVLEGLMTSERSIRKTTPIDPNQFKIKIKDLETQLKATEDPEEIKSIKQTMKSYGWNPEMEFNEASQAMARKRILDHYQAELEGFEFRDLIAQVFEPQAVMTEIHYEDHLAPVQFIIGPRDSFMIVGSITEADLEKAHNLSIKEAAIYEITFFRPLKILEQATQFINTPLTYPYVEFHTPSNVVTARYINKIFDYLEAHQRRIIVGKVFEGTITKEAVNQINLYSRAGNEKMFNTIAESQGW